MLHKFYQINKFYSFRMLTILREKFDPIGISVKKHELTSTNIIDLAQGCCQLTEILKVSLLSGIPESELQKEINIIGLDMKTLAENNAEKVGLLDYLIFMRRYIIDLKKLIFKYCSC